METAVLRRRCSQAKFDRRPLKKVKGVPKDQLHALVDKVEISANFEKEIKLNICMMKCAVAICLLITGFCVLAAVKSGDDSQTQRLSHEQVEHQAGRAYLVNASTDYVSQTLHQRAEQERKDLEQAMLEYNKTSVEDDEKTAQILLRAYNSIDRKNAFPKLMLFLVAWMIFCPLFMFKKVTRDKQMAYQSVSSLLNIENELYFCKKGHIWVVDHQVTRLRLVRTHDPKAVESMLAGRQVQWPTQSGAQNIGAARQSAEGRQDADPLLHKQRSGSSGPNAEHAAYYPGSPQPGMMMSQLYSPYGYYPMGYPGPSGYQQQAPFYHSSMQMGPAMGLPLAAQLRQPDLNPLYQGEVGPQHGQNAYGQQDNFQQKETSETGDESEDDEDDSGSDQTHSKHRSFGKRRRMNPDSGSVGAKFQTAKFAR